MLIPIMPFLSPQESVWRLGSKVVYDCTFPVEWKKGLEVPGRADFRNAYRRETQEKAIEVLERLGFKTE